MLIAEVEVVRTERLAPCLVRVELGGPMLADLSAEDGFDTRFKLVLPGPTGLLPTLGNCPQDWYQSWQEMADDVRSPMRTYTIRAVRTDPARLVVDMVTHPDSPDHPNGPAATWATVAAPGDRAHIVGPRRGGAEYGGREFFPDAGADLLLVADETGVPAVAAILRDCDPASTGRVLLEVPDAADRVALDGPAGVEVTWLVRAGTGAPVGKLAVDAVRARLHLPPMPDHTRLPRLASALDVEVWETVRFSSAGEDLGTTELAVTGGNRETGAVDLSTTYTWVAGESAMVKALRRTFVTEAGLPRRQGAFMGYWRRGVAMKS